MLHARTFERADGTEFDRIWSDRDHVPSVEAAATIYFCEILQSNVELPLGNDEDDDNA
jgi:hypothetical protein